jgi:diphthamide synthase (EF-2-diphthine--ammonia ligase)
VSLGKVCLLVFFKKNSYCEYFVERVIYRLSLQVESALATSNYVENIMVYADPFHNYCVALVVPAHQALEKWAQNSGINYEGFAELCQNDRAIKEVQQSLSKVRHNSVDGVLHD